MKRLTPAERIRLITSLLAVVALLAVVWLVTPLRNYLNVADLAAAAHSLENVPFAPLIVFAVYVVGSMLLVPITLILAATGLVFGAWPGLAYAFGGSLLSAMVIYGLGARLDQKWLRRLFGERVDAVRVRIAKNGVRAVLAVRLIPVAPFAVVSVVGGASRVSLLDYMIGTALGMTPGIVIKVVFTDQLAQAAETSNFDMLRQLGLLALAALLIAAGIRWYLARQARSGRRDDPKAEADGQRDRCASR